MKLGISSYSLYRAMEAKEMTILDAVEWVAECGGQHIEIVTSGFDLTTDPGLADAIRNQAQKVGIDVSNYSIGANFVDKDEAAFEEEVRRVIQEVDAANRLGVKRMRHDVAWRAGKHASTVQFMQDLPIMAEACRRIADYAAPLGIVTSVENHGYYIQASDRIQALIYAVNRPNFKTTLDIGNFICVDENPFIAVKNNIAFASMVHLKDFYVRPSYRDPGEDWFRSTGGSYIRGAIVGQGDIDMREVLRVIKHSGYDGYISIEFEGIEECRSGTRIGFKNALRIWNEV